MRLRDGQQSAAQFSPRFEAFTIVGISEQADKAVEIRSGASLVPPVFSALVKKAGTRTRAAEGGWGLRTQKPS